jgi:hypothetical protein
MMIEDWDEETTAVHEAAHAVVYWLDNLEVTSVQIGYGCEGPDNPTATGNSLRALRPEVRQDDWGI